MKHFLGCKVLIKFDHKNLEDGDTVILKNVHREFPDSWMFTVNKKDEEIKVRLNPSRIELFMEIKYE